MRIAVCLSGQLRTAKYALPSQVEFFKDFEVDYFCHTWSEGNDYKIREGDSIFWKNFSITLEDIDEAFNIVKPKKIKIGNYSDLPCTFPWDKPFYSLMVANYLKQKYEIENNFKYDLVIKSRYDIAFQPGMNFANYITKIHDHTTSSEHLEIYVNHISRMSMEFNKINASDVLFYGSSSAMDIFCDIYKYLSKDRINMSIYDYESLGPGCLMSEFAAKHNIRLSSFYFFETIYRKEAIPMDPLTNFAEIRNVAQNIYL